MRFPWPWNDAVDRCEVIVSELFEAQRLIADHIGEALRKAEEARDLKDRILAQEVVIKDLQRRIDKLEDVRLWPNRDVTEAQKAAKNGKDAT